MEKTFNRSLLKSLKSEIISYNRFISGQLKVIGFLDHSRSDTKVCDHFSYSNWVQTYKNYPIIKVEGLEDSYLKYFPRSQLTDIHLFFNQKSSYSFKWHTDNINVYLLVLKGFKRLEIRNKIFFLRPGEGVLIPKGHLHRAFSRSGTWALSLGYS